MYMHTVTQVLILIIPMINAQALAALTPQFLLLYLYLKVERRYHQYVHPRQTALAVGTEALPTCCSNRLIAKASEESLLKRRVKGAKTDCFRWWMNRGSAPMPTIR